jgi:hypothetical protein
MRYGFRRPSLKKRIAARTSWKRVVRHSMGFKAPRGYGWLTNPRKVAYNRIYSRTSRGCLVSLLVLILFVDVLIAAPLAFAGGHGSGSHSSGGTVHVSGYYRKDGTYVNAYDRSAPGTSSYSSHASAKPYSGSPYSPPIAPNANDPTTSTSLANTVAPATTVYVPPIPDNATVHVREHERQDGTHVKEYVRSAPGYADTVVAVATSSKREHHTPTKRSSSASTNLSSTNTALNHYSAIPYANSPTSGVQRDAYGRIKRNEAAKRDFMRQTGHPNGWPGHIVDHILPLKRGGCDCPENMQWQTVEEAKAKDKVE